MRYPVMCLSILFLFLPSLSISLTSTPKSFPNASLFLILPPKHPLSSLLITSHLVLVFHFLPFFLAFIHYHMYMAFYMFFTLCTVGGGFDQGNSKGKRFLSRKRKKKEKYGQNLDASTDGTADSYQFPFFLLISHLCPTCALSVFFFFLFFGLVLHL